MSATEASIRCPYVGLVPFEQSHADYFFGRSIDTEIVANHVLARPITVVFGPSGVGKTSLINVGLPRALEGLGVETVTETRREWKNADELDWLRGIGERVSRDEEEGPKRPRILILDQLEEFLVYANDERAETFARALANFIARRDVEVHVLLSIRQYALHRLKAMRSELPDLLETTLELRHLQEEEVRRAIEEPLRKWNEQHGTAIKPDPDFATTLIEQLRDADTLGSGADSGAIDLSYLQLVLQRIWDYEQQAKSDQLRTATLTGQLRGVAGIARAHVDEVLGRLSQPDRALCATLVDRLVTPSGGKVLYAATDLAKVAKVADDRMENVAARLAQGPNRLLREVRSAATADLPGYEIQHDILAKPFLDWLSERNRRVARRRRWSLHAAQFAVFALIFLGLSLWLIDRNERAQREDSGADLVPPPEDGRDRRLLSSLYLLWERSPDARRRDDAIVDLKKRGLLTSDLRPDAFLGELADVKTKALSEPARLLGRMASSLEQRDFLEAERAREELGRAKRARPADSRASEADANARDKWDGWSKASPQVLKPDGPGSEARRLLALKASAPSVKDAPDSVTGLGNGRPKVVAGDPDARVLVAYDDFTLRVWNAQDGLPIAVRPGCAGRTFDTALSRDGKYLAAACDDGSVRLWDLACGDVEVLKGDTGVVRALAFDPDATKLAAAARDGAVRIWQLRHESAPPLSWMCGKQPKRQTTELRILRRPDGKSVEVLGLAFSADGKQVVTASRDKTASVWEVTSGGQTHELRGHSDWVTSAAFSRDGQRVVTASYDGTARVWDVEERRVRHREAAAGNSGSLRRPAATQVLHGHRAQVYGATFGPDGRTVVTASKDGTVRVWDLAAESGAMSRVLSPAQPTPISAVYSADGKRVMAATGDGAVVVWDTASGRETTKHHLRIDVRRDAFATPVHFDVGWKLPNGGALSPEEKTLVDFYGALFGDASERSDAALPAARRLLDDLEREHPGSEHAMAARAAWQWGRERRDRSLIAGLFESGAPQGVLAEGKAVDAGLWALVAGYRSKADLPEPVRLLRRDRAGGPKELTSIAYSRDGRRVATASYDGSVRFWERADGGWKEAPARLEGSLGALTSVAFSPDGERVVTASYDGCARVWQWNGGKPRQQFGLQGPLEGRLRRPEAVYNAQFSPDGERVVTASRDGKARVWELRYDPERKPALERCLARGSPGLVEPGQTIVPSQELAPDAAGHAHAGCVMRDAAGPGGHHHGGTSHSVASAMFSADGQHVLTGSADACARIWDWKKGTVLQVLPGHRQRIHMAAFGPGAKEVVTASDDGTARIWWDWQRPDQSAQLGPHQGEVYAAAISPDRAYVVTAADDGVRVWSHIDGKLELRAHRRSGPIYAAAWDPRSRTPSVATASSVGVATTWDVVEKLDRAQFATELNYRVACSLVRAFPAFGCDTATPAGAVQARDAEADLRLGKVYAAMERADKPGVQDAFKELEDKHGNQAHYLAALAAGARATPPPSGGSSGEASGAGPPATRDPGPWARATSLVNYLRPPEGAESLSVSVARSVVVWPIWLLALTASWPIVRWARRRREPDRAGHPAADPTPNPVVRAWAGVADVVVAVVLGIVAGALGGMLVSAAVGVAALWSPGDELHLGFRGWDVATVLFIVVSSAYLLLRDAIKFQFRCSIGKSLFGLLPLLAQGDAELRLRDSARRNLLGVLIFLFVLLPCLVLIIWPHWRFFFAPLQAVAMHLSDSPLMAPWQQLGQVGLAVTIVALTALGLVDLTLSCFGDGRTLHDRVAKTKVVRLWTEVQEDAEEDDAPGAAAPATAPRLASASSPPSAA